MISNQINNFGFRVIILHIYFIWTLEQNYERNKAAYPTDSNYNLKENLHLKHYLEKTWKGKKYI